MWMTNCLHVIIFSLYICQCCEVNDFYFHPNPKGVMVREGASAFLECNVSNLCMINFQWTIGDKLVQNTSRRYQNGSNLVITKVNKSLDSEEFLCIATVASTGYSRQSSGAFLSIQWISDHVTVDKVRDSKTSAGKLSEIVLRCNVTGSEELNVRWFLNGRRLTRSHPAGSKFSLDDDFKLKIKHPGPFENGIYACEAKNSAGLVRSKESYRLAVDYPDLPKLRISPLNLRIKSGDQALFDCQFEPNNNLVWRKVDDEKFSTNFTNRIIHFYNGSLMIKDATQNDAGVYECVAFGKNGISHGFSATLTIAHINTFDMQNFVPASKIHYVGRNKDIDIECKPPEGNPAPVSYWKKGNEKLTSAGRVSATDDVHLKISLTRPEDQGDYHCFAENLAGKTFGTVKIVVTTKPKITYHPASKEVVEGSVVELKCDYDGDPFPATVVEWRKTGVLFTPNPRDTHVKVFGHNGTLLFDHVTKNDTGHYDCVVKTGGQDPTISMHAVITVFEKLKFAPKPVGRKFAFGTNAQISCVAVGHLTPRIKWFRLNNGALNGSVPKLDLNNNFPSNVREKNGVLYFNSVRFEDAGHYICMATSSQGLINETIKVEVYVFPTVIQAPKNTTQLLGLEVWLHCVVDGKPKPKIEWYYEGRVESDKWHFNYTRFANNTIFIQNVTYDHSGLYVCMAGNSGGFKRLEAILCVKNRLDHLAHCGPQRIGIFAPPSDEFSASDVIAGDDRLSSLTSGHDDTTSSSSTILVAVGLASGYFLLVVLFVVYCSYRRSRARRAKMTAANGISINGVQTTAVAYQNKLTNRNRTIPVNSNMGEDGENLLTAAPNSYQLQNFDTNEMSAGYSIPSPERRAVPQHQATSYTRAVNGSLASAAAAGRCSPTAASSIVSSCDVEKLKYARTSLEFKSLLGSGQFGEVHLMKIVYPKNSAVDPSHSNKVVVVKQFTNTKDDLACLELNREIEMYSKLCHTNIVKLIGVCVEKEPILVIYEYLEYGNLKHYLQASCQNYENLRASPGAYPPVLKSNQILKILHQVCIAMEYLTDQRFVHKDLAARNVLLSRDFTAKLCHLSLSGDAFAADYVSLGKRRRVPLRWLPVEAALDDEYSEASDVFSFGVLAWEVFAGDGRPPHANIADDQLVDAARRGAQPRLVAPLASPEPLCRALDACWETDARRRPTFKHLCDTLHQCLTQCNV